jgi:hypothetical protein
LPIQAREKCIGIIRIIHCVRKNIKKTTHTMSYQFKFQGLSENHHWIFHEYILLDNYPSR